MKWVKRKPEHSRMPHENKVCYELSSRVHNPTHEIRLTHTHPWTETIKISTCFLLNRKAPNLLKTKHLRSCNWTTQRLLKYRCCVIWTVDLDFDAWVSEECDFCDLLSNNRSQNSRIQRVFACVFTHLIRSTRMSINPESEKAWRRHLSLTNSHRQPKLIRDSRPLFQTGPINLAIDNGQVVLSCFGLMKSPEVEPEKKWLLVVVMFDA